MFDMEDYKTQKWVRTFFLLFIFFFVILLMVFSATAFIELSLSPSAWEVSARGAAVGVSGFCFGLAMLIIIATRHG